MISHEHSILPKTRLIVNFFPKLSNSTTKIFKTHNTLLLVKVPGRSFISTCAQACFGWRQCTTLEGLSSKAQGTHQTRFLLIPLLRKNFRRFLEAIFGRNIFVLGVFAWAFRTYSLEFWKQNPRFLTRLPCDRAFSQSRTCWRSFVLHPRNIFSSDAAGIQETNSLIASWVSAEN